MATPKLSEDALATSIRKGTPKKGRTFQEVMADIARRAKRGGLSAGDKAIDTVEGIKSPEDSPIRPAGEDLIGSEVDLAQDTFAAEKEDQERALELGETVAGDKEGLVSDIEGVRTGLQGQAEDVQANIDQQREDLKDIPQATRTEFQQLRQEFEQQSSVAFDRVDQQRENALAGVMRGQSAALQAAVQGIQGNINTAVSQIQANPNLTQAQKAGMIAQVRLQGASSLAPAVGATVLQFNTLAADVATKFGSISGSIQNTVLNNQAQLAGLQGQAFAQAQVEVGRMTNQLLEIESNSAIAFGQAQNQLLATRSMAENTANDLMLKLLPEQSTPYADFTNAAATRLTFENDMWEKNANLLLGQAKFGLDVAMIRAMQGTPMSNFLEGAISGFEQGGVVGAIAGGAGGLLGSLGPRV